MVFLTPEIFYLAIVALCCIFAAIFLWISKVDVIQGSDDETVLNWFWRGLFVIAFVILCFFYYKETLHFVGIV